MTPYILLVEDNPDDEKLILMSLAKHNIEARVEVCRDGAEALDFFAKAERLPALVLLDIKMPKVDGLEVLRQLRENERTRTLPVVIFTSSHEEEDIVSGYNYKCNGYVQKPVAFNEFSEAVRKLGAHWLFAQQGPPDGEKT